ncbi:MAG TPA: MFS transporter [Firmicutes bacterium]|nr:MFS transporter [Bacillota bacterium]
MLGVRYGIAYIGVALLTQVVVQWATYFYAPPLERGLPALLPISLVGLAMVLGRIVDAVADPLVGVWSDNSRYKGGRRLPFIKYGMIPLALSFILIWVPFGSSDVSRFLYLAFILSAFFFFYTVVVAPYLALLPELAGDHAERTKLSAWQAGFNIVGLAVAMVGASWLIEAFNFKIMGLVLGLVALASFAVTGFTVKERRSFAESEPESLWASMALTFQNKPFLIYLAAQLLLWFGFNMTMIAVPYVVTVLMVLDEGAVGLVLGVALLISVLCFPLVVSLSNKQGYKKTLILTMTMQGLVLAALGFVGKWPGGVPVLWQGLITVALAGFPLAGFFVIPNAMLAELTDYDYALTGRRREAIYFGVQGLILKSAIGLSSFILTYVLERYGFSVAEPLGVRISGPLAGFFVLAGVAALIFYPQAEVTEKIKKV